jgi:hypothetical protein
MNDDPDQQNNKTRTSGVPTGNAGEYFVMGELLRRDFDAQLADRNTKGYDLLAGGTHEPTLRKVQVKTVRAPPWYVNLAAFSGDLLDQVTIYVLIGKSKIKPPVRYFIIRNRDVADHVHTPSGWRNHGFVNMKAVISHEDRWEILRSRPDDSG